MKRSESYALRASKHTWLFQESLKARARHACIIASKNERQHQWTFIHQMQKITILRTLGKKLAGTYSTFPHTLGRFVMTKNKKCNHEFVPARIVRQL